MLSIPSTIIVRFLQNEDNTRILANPRLRAAEAKKTSLRIGTEVPIPVTTFAAANTGSSTFAPATSFNYKNVGVNLEITPRVNPNGTSPWRWTRSSARSGPTATWARGRIRSTSRPS